MKPATKLEYFTADLNYNEIKVTSRTAGSLKLGHTMTLHDIFASELAFCFPCCLEMPSSLFCHDPNPANPSKLKAKSFLDEYGPHCSCLSLNPVALLFVSHSLALSISV